jgi:hypothetical protein
MNMIRTYSSILIFLCSLAFLKAQSDINYQPKMLLSELGNLNNNSKPVLSEMDIPGASDIHVVNGKFLLIDQPVAAGSVKYVYIGRVNSCRSGGCSGNTVTESDQTSEYFDYYILFDARCTVLRVKVFNYQATHGQEITANGWLKQFIGYNGEKELQTGKNIDAISGATISVEGITFDIQNKTNFLKRILQ